MARRGVDRIGVALGLKVEPQDVPRHAVGHRRAEVAGKAVVPVGGKEREAHGVIKRLRLPHTAVEGVRPAVELIFPLVRREPVFLPVERKARAADAVAVAADHRAEIGPARRVGLGAVVTGQALAAPIAQAHHRGAQRHHRNGELPRLDRIERDPAEFRFRDHAHPPLLWYFTKQPHYITGFHDLQLTNIPLVSKRKLCYTDINPGIYKQRSHILFCQEVIAAYAYQ